MRLRRTYFGLNPEGPRVAVEQLQVADDEDRKIRSVHDLRRDEGIEPYVQGEEDVGEEHEVDAATVQIPSDLENEVALKEVHFTEGSVL